jgi:hypothetical protein
MESSGLDEDLLFHAEAVGPTGTCYFIEKQPARRGPVISCRSSRPNEDLLTALRGPVISYRSIRPGSPPISCLSNTYAQGQLVFGHNLFYHPTGASAAAVPYLLHLGKTRKSAYVNTETLRRVSSRFFLNVISRMRTPPQSSQRTSPQPTDPEDPERAGA